ncbi:MAG: hypothetical protein R3C28_12195 [Pirellulaceae bacterium]
MCDWFASHFQPDVVNFTNFLIGGCIPDLKQRFGSKIVVTLQGDDIFLESLPEKYRLQCIAEMQRLDQDVDAYLVFSEYYRDFMVDYLKLPVGKFLHRAVRNRSGRLLGYSLASRCGPAFAL